MCYLCRPTANRKANDSGENGRRHSSLCVYYEFVYTREFGFLGVFPKYLNIASISKCLLAISVLCCVLQSVHETQLTACRVFSQCTARAALSLMTKQVRKVMRRERHWVLCRTSWSAVLQASEFRGANCSGGRGWGNPWMWVLVNTGASLYGYTQANCYEGRICPYRRAHSNCLPNNSFTVLTDKNLAGTVWCIGKQFVAKRLYQPQTTCYKKLHQPATICHKTICQPETIRYKTLYQPETICHKTIYQPATIGHKTLYHPATIGHKTLYQPGTIGHKTLYQPGTCCSRGGFLPHLRLTPFCTVTAHPRTSTKLRRPTFYFPGAVLLTDKCSST